MSRIWGVRVVGCPRDQPCRPGGVPPAGHRRRLGAGAALVRGAGAARRGRVGDRQVDAPARAPGAGRRPADPYRGGRPALPRRRPGTRPRAARPRRRPGRRPRGAGGPVPAYAAGRAAARGRPGPARRPARRLRPRPRHAERRHRRPGRRLLRPAGRARPGLPCRGPRRAPRRAPRAGAAGVRRLRRAGLRPRGARAGRRRGRAATCCRTWRAGRTGPPGCSAAAGRTRTGISAGCRRTRRAAGDLADTHG